MKLYPQFLQLQVQLPTTGDEQLRSPEKTQATDGKVYSPTSATPRSRQWERRRRWQANVRVPADA